MKNSIKSKILFTLSLIFFFTSIAAKINNIYTESKAYEDRNVEVIIKNNVSKDEEKKILELISTMDEAVECFENDNISNEVKKQLVDDMIDSVNVINNKLNVSDDVLIKELGKQYDNLNEEKDITWDTLTKLYEKWKEEIL